MELKKVVVCNKVQASLPKFIKQKFDFYSIRSLDLREIFWLTSKMLLVSNMKNRQLSFHF